MKKKYQDLAALPIVALSKINGASLRKTQQYVQPAGENHSLTYLKDEEDDEGAFCSSYNKCVQVIESVTCIQEARESLGKQLLLLLLAPTRRLIKETQRDIAISVESRIR